MHKIKNRFESSSPDGSRAIVVRLPEAVIDTLTRLSQARGVEVSDLIRLSLLNLNQRHRLYDLGTRLGFGKYNGEGLETVIRTDPGYVRWAVGALDNFTMSEAALTLLDEMEAVNV